MNHIEYLEQKSIYIIREAYYRLKKIALLWSIGKDSTALLWLTRKAFFGEVPFPIVHIDTGVKFKEIYAFRDTYARAWNLNLIVSRNTSALQGKTAPLENKFECCNLLKTESLKSTIREHNFKALLLAIRRDEHGIRAKERYFSPRDVNFQWNYQNQAPELWDLFKANLQSDEHLRIHPMLHWTELDIWEYIHKEKIPIPSLYFAHNGKRYRSIGCQPCCAPVDSNANTVTKIIQELRTTNTSERAGRAQDKENTYTMQKLRSLGYM